MRKRTIVLTRPSHAIRETADLVRERGAEPFLLPLIEIKEIGKIFQARRFANLLRQGKIAYVVLTSRNGVDSLLRLLHRAGEPEPSSILSQTRIVAIGPNTAKRAAESGLRVWRIPVDYTSEGILELLARHARPRDAIYLVRAANASNSINRKLRALGLRVVQLSVYRNVSPNRGRAFGRFLRLLESGEIDAIVFGAASSVTNLFRMLHSHPKGLEFPDMVNRNVILVAIGPATARMMRKFGLDVDVVPHRHTFRDALDDLERYWRNLKARGISEEPGIL